MVWAAGQRLYGDRYVIDRKLGEGGFGITYLARNRKGEPVVVKTLQDYIFTDSQYQSFREKYLQNFQNEALKLSLCRHPHIVQIENTFNEDQYPCMVMEYIKGYDLLNGYCLTSSVLSESEIVRYIWQIGSALEVVHEKGLLHRDLKPDNIMIRPNGQEAVLIDFGITREFLPNVTLQQSLVLATEGYAPIEQYNSKTKLGEYTDVYALVATLYCLLTKQTPTNAIDRVLEDDLIPPKRLNPKISDRVNAAILQGLAVRPQDRPQTMQAWLSLLPDVGFQALQSPPRSVLPRPPMVAAPAAAPVMANLRSQTSGVDYTKLRDLLQAQQWKEADRETYLRMLEVVGRKDGDYLRGGEVKQFPCEDLRIIDQLWVKYSNGKFGFSVQKKIWQECLSLTEYNEQWEQFGSRVGWYVKGNWYRAGKWIDYLGDVTFSTTVVGHLPVFWLDSGLGLFDRVVFWQLGMGWQGLGLKSAKVWSLLSRPDL